MEVNEFRTELLKRLRNKLREQSFDEMTVGGSKLRFEMTMCTTGESGLLTEQLFALYRK